MLGFKRFRTAAVTIAGIELLRRIHKGQFNLGKLRLKHSSAPAVWNAVLAAAYSRLTWRPVVASTQYAPKPVW